VLLFGILLLENEQSTQFNTQSKNILNELDECVNFWNLFSGHLLRRPIFAPHTITPAPIMNHDQYDHYKKPIARKENICLSK
jgi:hypothetical protein